MGQDTYWKKNLIYNYIMIIQRIFINLRYLSLLYSPNTSILGPAHLTEFGIIGFTEPLGCCLLWLGCRVNDLCQVDRDGVGAGGTEFWAWQHEQRCDGLGGSHPLQGITTSCTLQQQGQTVWQGPTLPWQVLVSLVQQLTYIENRLHIITLEIPMNFLKLNNTNIFFTRIFMENT